MAEHFFDTDFNFGNYISDRLLEIRDEDERRILKEVMKETLIPFYQQTEEAYKDLEKRLMASKTDKNERFEVITGIMDRSRVDITEEAMVPMKYEDIYEQTVDVEEMKEYLEAGNGYTVMRVFFRMDYTMIQQAETEDRLYKGTICTQDAEYPAFFSISRNQEYLQQIAELYPVFEKNGIDWSTVCAPYLFKFFDVKVIRTECPETAQIQRITVDFEEYQKYVDYNVIPMWNVRILEERSSAYPTFAIDKIHYEHVIYKGRLEENRDYLVDSNNAKIWNIFTMDGDMHLICDADKPVRWKLIEFNYESLDKSNYLPVFGNYSNGKSGRRCIHTYGETMRYIKALGYEKYLELEDIVPVREDNVNNRCTYSMDWFMQDEIRNAPKRPYMLFRFKAVDGNNYLNKDIMSYLVSKIQWQLPEYDCIGELI